MSFPVRVLSAAVSGTTAFNGTPTVPGASKTVTYQFNVPAGVTGTPSAQISNSTDEEISALADIWTAHTGVPSSTVTGPTTVAVEVVDCNFYRVRPVWTNVSGSGTVSVNARGG